MCKYCEGGMDLSEVFKSPEGEVVFTLCFCETCGSTAKVYEQPSELHEVWSLADGTAWNLDVAACEGWFENLKLIREVKAHLATEETNCVHCQEPMMAFIDDDVPLKVKHYVGCSICDQPRSFVRDDEPFTRVMVQLFKESGETAAMEQAYGLELHYAGLRNQIHGCDVCKGANSTWENEDSKECCNQRYVMRPMAVTEMIHALKHERSRLNTLKAAEKIKW